MRIGIVGGLDRKARELEGIARAWGHELELPSGVIAGAASAAGLRALVGRVDLIIVVTEVNSHNGVRMARRHAQLAHRPLQLLRRMGVSQFEALVRALPGAAVGAILATSRWAAEIARESPCGTFDCMIAARTRCPRPVRWRRPAWRR